GAGVRVGHAVALTVEGDPTVYRGRVVRLSPIVQEQNRTLLVEAEVPNERGFLRPGSFARVDIMTEVSQPVITVPSSAIIVFAGVEKVLVVRQGKSAEVRVTTGRRLGEDVEIVDGLKRGDPVIARPGNLVGGQPVTQLAQRLEEQINTIQGINELRSICGPGTVIVIVTFNLNRQIDVAAQDVRDKVAIAVRNMPREILPPIIAKFDNDQAPVVTI